MIKAVVHAMDRIAENGIQPLSSSVVAELIHKADEVTLSESGSTVLPRNLQRKLPGPHHPGGRSRELRLNWERPHQAHEASSLVRSMEDEAETWAYRTPSRQNW